MKKAGLVLSGAALLACGAVVPSALGSTPAGPAVKVEIKSLKKTLLRPTIEHGEKGWITKGGTPRGVCSGNSGAGALDAAAHGRWTGKYYASLHDIFVTSIDGVKPTGSDYWSVLVNGKTSSVGICETKLHRGELIEFKEVK